MDLFEYQGKQLLRDAASPPPGEGGVDPEEARAAAEQIGGRVVVKAQVQIGGRGKAGGIKLAGSPAGAGPGGRHPGNGHPGHTVRAVVEEASAIAREYYASITFDRAAKQPLAMLSAVGGMDIEEVARTPSARHRLRVDPHRFQPHDAREPPTGQGHRLETVGGVVKLLGVRKAFVGLDAMLVEINPLVQGRAGGSRAGRQGEHRQRRSAPPPGAGGPRGHRPRGPRSAWRATRASPT